MTINLTLEELAARYDLLCRCTQVDGTPPKNQQLEAHFQTLNKLLKYELHALNLRDDENILGDIFSALEQELERLRIFSANPELAQKFTVAFGGGFSAGKSSLINTLLGKRLLATEVDPTTSLPTCLLHGEQNSVYADNLSGQRIILSHEEFLSLTHDEEGRYGSRISRLLRSAFIVQKDFPWHNLALIDTPGYTRHEVHTHGSRTDEHIARNQLNASDVIVWVIDARNGCITESDLKFLATVQTEIPRLIVISRADQKTSDEIRAIVRGIKDTLTERKLPFVDVIAVSARPNQPGQLHALRSQLTFWNQPWNQHQRVPNFPDNFTAQLSRCVDLVEKEQERAKHRSTMLNGILHIANIKGVHIDVTDAKQEARGELFASYERGSALLDLRNRFFCELASLGEHLNVDSLKLTSWATSMFSIDQAYLTMRAERLEREYFHEAALWKIKAKRIRKISAPDSPKNPQISLLALMKFFD